MKYEKYRIYEETDYDRFDMHEFNRNTHEHKELYASMRKHGFHWQNAIACVKNGGGRLKIIQGHNRFVVAKALGLPVFFTVEEAEKAPDVHELEPGNKQWTLCNYVEAFSRAGYEDYQFVKRWADESGINLAACLAMFNGQVASGAGNQSYAIQHGKYHIRNTVFPERVRIIIETMKAAGLSWAHKSAMVQAVSICCAWTGFDDQRFISKIRTFPYLFEDVPLYDACLQQCEHVYNYRANPKVPLAFKAREASAARKAKIMNKQK